MAVAQWVRRWNNGHRVVQAEGSSPGGDVPGIPKNARSLIRCMLKTTIFTRSAFIFSEFSYFNLKLGIKQSKIG